MGHTVKYTKSGEVKIRQFTLLRKLKCSIYLIKKKKMLLMKSEFSPVFFIKMLLLTKKHSLMSRAPACGKFSFIQLIYYEAL